MERDGKICVQWTNQNKMKTENSRIPDKTDGPRFIRLHLPCGIAQFSNQTIVSNDLREAL